MSSVTVITCILLVVWAAFLLLPESEGCMETAWSSGYLTSVEASFTFVSRASSCRCCGLCHQSKTCASLSYNKQTKECQLYSNVASYGSLKPNDTWQYFVMPGRSQHHQFCRQDSDCQAEGDFCRGRVCTKLHAVTCRVIFETFGAGESYGEIVSPMFGWLNNTDIFLACRMGPGYHGYTRLIMNQDGLHELNNRTLMKFNIELSPGTLPHSILSLEEYIRLAGNGTTYSIKVFRCDQRFMIDFEMPRMQPVLSNSARPGMGSGTVSKNTSCVTFTLSPPYLTGTGPTWLTVNADDPSAVEGAIVRDDGQISWKPCGILNLLVYMRE